MKLDCYGHTVNGKCPISIKMTTDTNKIIDIGSLNLDLFKCNESTQTKVSNNGYTLAVVGPCEIRVTKN